jgi:hypothetical protein
MADKPTGPVKPPTLDLKARKPESEPDKATRPSDPGSKPEAVTPSSAPGTGDAGKPELQAQAPISPQKDAPKPAPPQKPQAAAELPLMPLAATAIGGAVLGLAAAYGLALAGLWPTSGPSGLAPLETRIARTENTLELRSSALSALDDRVGALENAGAAETPQLPDNLLTEDALAPLQSRIETLGLQIDAVATGMPADEAAVLTAEISRLGNSLADIEARLDQPDDEIDALPDQLATLSARLETLEAQAANQASIDAMRAERDRFAGLPAASAALETAIASGRAFGAELASIEALLPELGLTNAARAIAANGVKPAREIAHEFRALIPALLAARPENPDANWFDTIVNQAQSAIALRPVDDGSDTPEAIIGRIETALDTGDMGAARALILTLPEPMHAIAGPVRADLDAVIAARAILADIRALVPASTPEAGQ